MNERITRRDFLKVAGIGTIAAAVGGFVVKDTSAKPPSEPFDYSKLDFRPVETHVPVFESPSPSPSAEQTLSPGEQRMQNLLSETAEHVRIAKETGEYTNKWIDALEMYGPIYIAAAKEYEESGIDWKMLWITHMMESGGSAKDSTAFSENNYPYVGGMQRSQEVWPDEFIEAAFEPLRYLSSIPTNHDGDAKEIVGAAAIMAPNMELYGKLGKENAVFNTFSLYTASEDSAGKRRDLWIIANEIFPDKKMPTSLTVRKAS